VCHIAYGPTLEAPTQVKTATRVFLEFAPIRRQHDRPFEEQRDLPPVDRIEMLDANLERVPARNHPGLGVLADVSRFSNWRRPATKLPWDKGRRAGRPAELSPARHTARHEFRLLHRCRVRPDARRSTAVLTEYGQALRG